MGTLSDVFESLDDKGPPNNYEAWQQAQEAREVAAARIKQTVAPGERPTIPIPEHLQSYGNFASAVGAGLRETATDIIKHPENLVGTGELGGVARPIARSILSPAQIQERLSQLNRDLSRGRIGEQEYQAGRQEIGLSPASQDRISPLSAAASPRPQMQSFRRDPSERTMEELFAHNPDVTRPVTELHSTGPKGVLLGTESARQIFDQRIAPHIDEKSFATKYFDGMYSQNIRMSGNPQGELYFTGPLFRGGQGRVGKIERTLIPNEARAYHNYFELEPHVQGSGIAKPLMRNQFDIYKTLGINRVDLSANIDVGGYSWAKYGFVPITQGPGGWFSLQNDLRERLRFLRSPGKDLAERLINTTDPFVIWDIADLAHPAQNIRYGQSGAEVVPLGKALLLGQDWRGTFDFNNQDMMRKFDRYVSPK